ncbi:hypothetical protein [Kitasatospora purpeofusca]|uniref:hypothetical protein n=1 Tax=Kitasatospora purpeofusca TaxID=67352 RepID=UPI002B1DA07D|nr:hypothetical protein [Kitasatospora purpeofusca]
MIEVGRGDAGTPKDRQAGGLGPRVGGLLVQLCESVSGARLFDEASSGRSGRDPGVAGLGRGGEQDGQLRPGGGLFSEAFDECVDGPLMEQGEQARGGEGESVGYHRPEGQGGGEVEAGVEGEIPAGGFRCLVGAGGEVAGS